MFTIIISIIAFGLVLGFLISCAFLILLRAGKADEHALPVKAETPLLHTEPQAEYHRKQLPCKYWRDMGIDPPHQCRGNCDIFNGVTHRQCLTCNWDDL